jgi:N-acetylmuramoyl-L-alanine amidase
MKTALPKKLATLATIFLASFAPFHLAKAQTNFGEQNLNQSQVIAVANPFGDRFFNLLVIEQIPGKQQCWSESGSNPVLVNLLLLNFNFSGSCKRATDSNGYSIRIDGQDYGLQYVLNFAERDGELLLVGKPSLTASDRRSIIVGRTRGNVRNAMKVFLEPGWKFSQRTFEGKGLGHTYFSTTASQVTYLAPGTTTTTPPVVTRPPSTVFPDISNDIYRDEIEQAVQLGFIAGFKEDNTFRPLVSLTREQLVSMVIEALTTLPNSRVNVPNTVTGSPFSDVVTSRWSAPKIAWAKSNNLISGYKDGTFKPTQPVTRAELMAILRRAAEYAHTQQGQAATLKQTKTPTNFTDISNHWAESLIREMSGFCGVATPMNETGTNFAPDSASMRNYAAAATLRTLNCLKSDS